jgi:hypothetical protein
MCNADLLSLKPDGQANSGKVKIENAGTKYENVPP